MPSPYKQFQKENAKFALKQKWGYAAFLLDYMRNIRNSEADNLPLDNFIEKKLDDIKDDICKLNEIIACYQLSEEKIA